MNPKVDFYFNKAQKWQQEIERMRTIMLDCGLSEELKWGCPCYTFQKNNIALIHVFKEYCGVLFFKGALMDNAEGLLIQQTENVQATRQVRYTNLQGIIKSETTLKAFIYEAIEIEKAGLKVELKKPSEFKITDELQQKLDELPDFKTAFYALTPGRQRGYLLYFAQPKQAKTREARIEKCMPLIFNGKGWNEV